MKVQIKRFISFYYLVLHVHLQVETMVGGVELPIYGLRGTGLGMTELTLLIFFHTQILFNVHTVLKTTATTTTFLQTLAQPKFRKASQIYNAPKRTYLISVTFPKHYEYDGRYIYLIPIISSLA